MQIQFDDKKLQKSNDNVTQQSPTSAGYQYSMPKIKTDQTKTRLPKKEVDVVIYSEKMDKETARLIQRF